VSKTILIVEDEPKLAGLMSDYLLQAGFLTHIIDNGLSVADWVRRQHPDLMILDLMLPGKDGVAVCREVRAFSDLPIIMATARVDEIDRLIGLETGADDYVCKPFSFREVVARVQAVLRRTGRQQSNDSNPHTDTLSPPAASQLVLYQDRYQAVLKGTLLELTVVEFKLLATLVSEPGRIFSRDQLMQRIYNEYRVVSDRTIDSHIKKLRHKMRTVAAEDYIYSIYGAGYKFELPD
jgi:two-component system response regulator BaeR